MSKYFTAAFLAIGLSTASIAQGKFPDKPLDMGKQIPEFSLKDQDGKIFNMADSVGSKIYVIFFYPKDESVVCTKEAVTFRDSMNAIKKAGAEVVGINKGSIESHKKFQQDDGLNFELLSDPDETVLKKFGIKGGLLSNRVTYVVDLSGQIVAKCESNTDGKEHVLEVMQYFRAVQRNQQRQKKNQ
jgi:peroxiredoxin Q/BCP